MCVTQIASGKSDPPRQSLLRAFFEYFILHSSVLAAASPFFRSGLTGWGAKGKTVSIFHPVTRNSVAVKVLALSIKEQTYVLEGMDVETDKTRGMLYLAMESCTLSTGGRPEVTDDSLDLNKTKRALRAMFGLLYGCAIPSPFLPTSDDKKHFDQGAFDFIVNLGALAEYYECLDVVGPLVSKAMRNNGTLWSSIIRRPYQHALLAKKLGDSEAFHDAIRHKIAQATMTSTRRDHLNGLTRAAGVISDLMKVDPGTVVRTIMRQLPTIEEKTRAMEKTLHAIQLCPSDRIESLVGVLAHAYFGQWVAAMLNGKEANQLYGNLEDGTTGPAIIGLGKTIATARMGVKNDSSDEQLLSLLNSAFVSSWTPQHPFFLPKASEVDQKPSQLTKIGKWLIKCMRFSAPAPQPSDPQIFCSTLRQLLAQVVKQTDVTFPRYLQRCYELKCNHSSCSNGEEWRCTISDDHPAGYTAYFRLPAVMREDRSVASRIAMSALTSLHVDITPASTAWLEALVPAEIYHIPGAWID